VQASTRGFFNRSPILDTNGSASLLKSWQPLREAAAAARELMIAAAAASWQVPKRRLRAAAGEVVDESGGRRARYGELLEAASKLRVPRSPRLTPARDYRLIGRPTRRLEGPSIVGGREPFSLDARAPGQLFAVVARCPVFGGALRRYDDGAARREPGVRHVVAIQSGVAVVADSTWEAMRGRAALEIDWSPPERPALDSAGFDARLDAALAGDALVARSTGEIETGLASSSRRITARYATAFQAHAPMEPPNALVHRRSDGGEVRCGTQSPHLARARAARLLGLGSKPVFVQPMRMGGGFGRKEEVDYVEEACEVAAAIGGGPVQLVWTREDDLRHDHYHPPSRHRLEAGLDERGGLLAWSHRVASPWSGRFRRRTNRVGRPEIGGTLGAHDLPYAVPHLIVEHAEVRSPFPLGYWRGIEFHFNVFAVESFVDELAHAAGVDPVRFRRQALVGPARELERGRLDPARLRAVLDLAAERSDWGSPLPGGLGRGVACHVFDGHTCCALVAEVRPGAGGFRVERVVVALDCGRVVNPLSLAGNVESAVAWGLSALSSEITFEGGRTVPSNFLDYPILRLHEMPRVEVHTVESDEAPSGTGEIPVPAVAPAVANALFAASGRRPRSIPFRAEDLA
jgi:isoquinoline 1-oxidoreductase beta subunit